ncbi:hypothetical protein D3C73_1634550 [compost metagenome]
MGQNLDRIDLAKLRQCRGDRGQPILIGLHYQDLNITRQVGGELLAAFDTAVEH